MASGRPDTKLAAGVYELNFHHAFCCFSERVFFVRSLLLFSHFWRMHFIVVTDARLILFNSHSRSGETGKVIKNSQTLKFFHNSYHSRREGDFLCLPILRLYTRTLWMKRIDVCLCVCMCAYVLLCSAQLTGCNKIFHSALHRIYSTVSASVLCFFFSCGVAL